MAPFASAVPPRFTVPAKFTYHSTKFGSVCVRNSNKWQVTQLQFVNTNCCMNHIIKLAMDQFAKCGGIRICWRGVQSKRYSAHCPLVFGACCPQRRPQPANWNRGRSCSRRSPNWEMLRPQRPQRHQPESVWTTHAYSAGRPSRGPHLAGSMPCGLASSASSGPAAAAAAAAATAPATALPRGVAMALLKTSVPQFNELNAKVDYVAGQVQVLMDQSCQAV